jgi:hypothetical protein
MIFYDKSISLDSGKETEDLRIKTGADAIVSLKKYPIVTDAMLKKHIASGCILYRIVHAIDVKDSDPKTLLFNLSKMASLGARTFQCALLFDDSRELFNYDHYIKIVDLWVDHGGVVYHTFGNTARYYLEKRDSTLAETNHKVDVLVPNFAPRTEIQVLKDWQVTLASFPGVGWSGAKAIREMVKKRGYGDDLLTCLWFLTDTQEIEKTDNQTMKKIRVDARKWLGLPDGMNIDISVILDKETEDGSSI